MFCRFVLIPTTILTLATLSISLTSSEDYKLSNLTILSSSLGVQKQDELLELLNTEKVIIDILKHYIESQEYKLKLLKRKTLEIRDIHNGVNDREKYLYNPINALTILKRFSSDWSFIKSYAEDYLATHDLTSNYSLLMETLTFPSLDDYDEALINLLRVQDMYQLKPQCLAVGEINGVKLGTEMTWSDCLEIGLQSSKHGYQTYAKYWMKTALEKLSNIDTVNNAKNNNDANAPKQERKRLPQDDNTVSAQLIIMKALLHTEYKLCNLNEALQIANEMSKVKPKQKSIIDAKKKIEKELRANDCENKHYEKKREITKTTKELMMVEQICRKASSFQAKKQIHDVFTTPWYPTTQHTLLCSIVTNNAPFLLEQTSKRELLSLDPYIVIYHNILSDRQIEELKHFIIEKQDDTFQFTKIGHKKLLQIDGKLQHLLGYYGQGMLDDWQVERYDFESLMELSETSITDETGRQAKLLLSLQQPLLGGAVIFPQLELSINLPQGSLLYWSILNKSHDPDNRSKFYMCPVIGGSQITATTSVIII